MVQLDNYAKKVGRKGDRDWYEWKVFVDANRETLDKIDHVEYLLHPTFPNPRRIVSDKDSKFALESSGWGQFNVAASISYTDGTQEDVKQFLDFRKKWPD